MIPFGFPSSVSDFLSPSIGMTTSPLDNVFISMSDFFSPSSKENDDIDILHLYYFKVSIYFNILHQIYLPPPAFFSAFSFSSLSLSSSSYIFCLAFFSSSMISASEGFLFRSCSGCTVGLLDLNKLCKREVTICMW